MAHPVLGWTFLSADAIRRAEAGLRNDAEGVRDEVGFLYLHEQFADRFFPGTSVQHTRLRYALFVPWIYESIIEDLSRTRRISVNELVARHEVTLTGNLLRGGERDRGTIGQLVFDEGRPSSQPSSMVYWSALGEWGLLRELQDGSLPSRAAVHRWLSSSGSHRKTYDDDGGLLEEPRNLFTNVPKRPGDWAKADGSLTFELSPNERAFLVKQLLTTKRPSGEPSLLARLASQPTKSGKATTPWERSVSSAADREDSDALVQAKYAAALAAVGRGVYAALVEHLRDERDGLSTSYFHRNNLNELLALNRDDALSLDISAAKSYVTHIPEFLVTILLETQNWLNTDRNVTDLLGSYSDVESKRKGSRSRLLTTALSRQRRAEWNNEKHPKGERLHYRWRVVRRMLQDLGS